MYRIYDITFKGLPQTLCEQYTISAISRDKAEGNEVLMKGNIFDLRKMMIKGYRDETIVLKV